MSVLNGIVSDNIGMAMIFTLVQAAKDWLKDRAGGGAIEEDPETLRKRAEAEEEARRQAARAHGTMVTSELFMTWKAKFDAEMAAIKAKQAEAQTDPEKTSRLTGKAYFMNLAQQGDGMDAGLEGEEEEEEEDEEEAAEEEDEEEEFNEDEDDDDDESFLEEIAAKGQQ